MTLSEAEIMELDRSAQYNTYNTRSLIRNLKYVYVSECKKYYFFRNFCARTTY